MKIERTKNARNGIAVGMVLRLYQTIVPFLMRTAMMYFMGVEYLGLNSLFSSILHILNLSELGVGVVMVYSMYRPIAEDDTARICALMRLYRKYYRLIGVVIGIVGLLLLPFIPALISEEIPSELNIYTLYLLNLSATVLTYWLFAYRNCLLQAHQRMDISSAITIASSTVQYALQILVLVYVKDYYLYVMILLLGTIANNVLTAVVTGRKYPQYQPKGDLPPAEVAVINGKIRDLFSGKLGSVVLQHADTVVISSFLGLTVLAIYQNYYYIMSSVIAIVEMIISSITAGLGNSFIMETREKNENDLMKFSFMFLWMMGICCCCFLGLYQPFMRIWVGDALMLNHTLVICMTVYFFAFTLNRLLSIYKDAAGLWHEDRFGPLITSCINLAMNLLMVKKCGLFGVVLSTVFALCFVELPWRHYIVFTRVFTRKAFDRFIAQLMQFVILIVISGTAVCLVCTRIDAGQWETLILCLIVSVILPNCIFGICLYRSEQMRPSIQMIDRLTKGKLGLERHLYPVNGTLRR